MNISQPTASAITGVDFNFLPAHDIRALSVKRIVNPTTFDSLLNPVPGGLYDAAFGAFMDNRCTTCNLDKFGCPGHCGHIELPVPVYHPTFMDQSLRLLRAKCVYCHHFQLSAIEVHRYACMFRLIRHGLIKEASEVKDVRVTSGYESDASEDDDREVQSIIAARNRFVKTSIKRALETEEQSGWKAEKTESVSEFRKALVKSFLVDIGKPRLCGKCKGISPTYRKDRYVKIFKKPLSQKSRATMVQGGFKAENPLAILDKRAADSLRTKKKDVHADEGVADMEVDNDEEMEDDGEDVNSDVDVDGSILVAEAASGSATKAKDMPEERQEYVSAGEVRAALTLLFEKEHDILGLIYGPRSRTKSRNPTPPTADIFFIQTMLVPPSKYRPESKTGESEISENPRNTLYRSILQACELLNQISRSIRGLDLQEGRRQRTIDDLNNAWLSIQEAVNSLMDKERSSVQGAAAKSQPDGIKQVLEKKEGLFRMHMMGKRVNFAARSVISPDPNIETNEIGVPPVFAVRLTYPEPVTNHNFYELKEAVINGPDKWPGAVAVETETGQVINLRRKNAEERLAIANQLLAPSNTNINGARNKKVHRHLNNGDVLIMNRQPTLHKPSMMVHRARVLPGEKTIRMHYANCNTYNADFDGDEMNMHFPQNETARAEAATIADTDHQYLSGTAGSPLRGLIQDHISICVWLCNRDIFFNREDYQQLLYAAIRPEDNHTSSGTILTVKPAIIKPNPLWTGKQVVTTILLNIKPETHPGLTLSSSSQTSPLRWGQNSEEGVVVFDDGEFISGILDKKHIGPKHGGFVSAVYETYGHTIAGRLLSVMGRLLTKLLHMRAFSCGVEDLILTPAGETARTESLKDAAQMGLRVAAKYVSLSDQNVKADDPELKRRLEGVLRDDHKQHGLDLATNGQTKNLSSEVTRTCLPDGLIKPFPRNQMQTMTGSGAKGSDVNANLISCNLGQQVLEGRRVPVMVSGKTLPCFRPYESSVRAGGYITDRFLTGIRPQEYFFHAMAGREGLIDTAVKTSRSGYLQRCLVKNMEGLKVEYDTSVRDSDGSVVQFLYGEDGLDVTKSTYLNDFKFLANNFFSMYESLNIREHYPKLQSEEASDWTKKAWKKVAKTGDLGAMDPALAVYNPNRHCGSTSEKFFAAKRKYFDENPDKLLKKKKTDLIGKILRKNFEAALEVKYLKSIVEPGEAVGIIAGQSVGEPSTQMTLNTFHLAGHSTKNVTLGIPRLREIVMTASASISTPSMTIHLNDKVAESHARELAKSISRLSLAEVVDKASVTETVGKGVAYGDARMYKIRLEFYPADEYCEEYGIEIEDVVNTLETKYIPQLSKAIKKELKKKRDERSSKAATESEALPDISKSVGTIEQARPQTERRRDADDEEDDEQGDEDDATAAKARANRAEGEDYDDPDEDEEAIAERLRKEDTTESDAEDEAYGSQEDSAPSDSEEAQVNGENEASSKIKKGKKQRSDALERESRIKAENDDVTSFAFDEKKGQWCEITFEYAAGAAKLLMLHIVESACYSTNIRATPGIATCTYATEKVKDEKTHSQREIPILITEGENLLAMRNHQDVIDANKMFTNDIAAMLRLYGVEACRATIVQEMAAVFGGHGIDVDLRHLNLIADTMTRGGGFKAFNRMGIDSNVSPLMKMSFETTVGFLKDAVSQEDSDDLKNPSARIVMGRLGKIGTGAFDVMVPVA